MSDLMIFATSGVGLFLLGAVTATLTPSVTDPIHFWLQTNFFNKTKSRSQWMFWQIFDRYILDASWYIILFFTAFFMSVNNLSGVKKMTIIASMIGFSVTIGVITLFLMHKRRR
jgi:hypothetical protein